MKSMRFRLSQDFKKPSLDLERSRVMIGLCLFEKRIQSSPDCDELTSLTFEICTDDGTLYKKVEKLPALSLIKQRTIVINLAFCAEHELSNDYAGLIAHELGHIFPQHSHQPKLLQDRLPVPGKGFHPFGVPSFDSAKGAYRNFAADFYACRWGLFKEIASYRFKRTGDPHYEDVLAKYTDETEFRLAAYHYRKSTHFWI